MAASELNERIRAILQPLQDELARVEARIRVHEETLAAAKEERRRIQAILRQANGEAKRPGPKPKAKRMGAKGDRWLDTVRIFIREMDAEPEPRELIASHVYDYGLEDAKRNGLKEREYPGADSVRRAMERLHEFGELRIIRRATGGAPVYQRTNRGE